MQPELYSAIEAVGNNVELDTNWTLPNCFVGIQYFDADPRLGAANEVVPGAGTITVKAKLVNHGKYVDITDGVFTCTIVNSFASFVGNASSIQAVPAGVTTALFYKLVITQNAS